MKMLIQELAGYAILLLYALIAGVVILSLYVIALAAALFPGE